jgi:hypothetical protein
VNSQKIGGGILSDMNDMSAEDYNRLITAAFVKYISYKEQVPPQEALRRLGILCEITQKALAIQIVSDLVPNGI